MEISELEALRRTGRTVMLLRVLRRLPVTAMLTTVILLFGLVSGSLTSERNRSWWELGSYGLQPLGEGRWWTPLTGTFLLPDVWTYVAVLLAMPLVLGWLEYQRGSRATAYWFLAGQLFAFLTTVLFVGVIAAFGSLWAQNLAAQAHAGPWGGLAVCCTIAGASLPSPWRSRLHLVLIAFGIISVVFLGGFADLMRAFGVAGALALTAGRFTRQTTRERRFMGWVLVTAVGITQFVLLTIPTQGPLEATEPGTASIADVVVDGLIVVVLANALRHGYRLAWLLTVLLALLNVSVGVLAAAFLVFVPAFVSEVRGDFALAVGTATLWLLTLIYLVIARTSFRVRVRRRFPEGGQYQPDTVRRVLRSTGGGTLSWMTTWANNRHFLGSNSGTVVAYQVHAGIAIALSDPIATPAEQEATLKEWVAAVQAEGFTPCVFGASPHIMRSRPSTWRALQIAEDTIVDLPGLAFKGKPWNSVRTAINRANRENISFRLTTLADEPRSVLRQLQEISDYWVGDKGLPEMRFTLGTLDEAMDPAVKVAIAQTPDGTIDGFLSWLPIYSSSGEPRGWTLDLMRRRDGGFPPVMEFLIASSCMAFRDAGAALVSLSGAPLAKSDAEENSAALQHLLERLGAMLEPVYGFRSLHHFKQKFNPRPEPVFLLFENEVDLPAIGFGLTRAFLPDASMRELIRAGVDTARPKTG